MHCLHWLVLHRVPVLSIWFVFKLRCSMCFARSSGMNTSRPLHSRKVIRVVVLAGEGGGGGAEEEGVEIVVE